MSLVELLHLVSETGVEISPVSVSVEELWKFYITDKKEFQRNLAVLVDS